MLRDLISRAQGRPWDILGPTSSSCEYEDAKTVPMGHTWRDVADFFASSGYAVYVSEWHPIVRYGVAHDWRRVVPYPGPTSRQSSWGNLLAFREDPGFGVVVSAFERLRLARAAALAMAAKAASKPPAKKPPAARKKRPAAVGTAVVRVPRPSGNGTSGAPVRLTGSRSPEGGDRQAEGPQGAPEDEAQCLCRFRQGDADRHGGDCRCCPASCCGRTGARPGTRRRPVRHHGAVCIDRGPRALWPMTTFAGG